AVFIISHIKTKDTAKESMIISIIDSLAAQLNKIMHRAATV
ncbi:MAG: hypothetical protein K0R84_2818, partial [Clostridia bacterium]|nr:hypothetical protein [Clostridia bacterium]